MHVTVLAKLHMLVTVHTMLKKFTETESFKLTEIEFPQNARFCAPAKLYSCNTFFPQPRSNQKYSHANVFNSCDNFNFRLPFS